MIYQDTTQFINMKKRGRGGALFNNSKRAKTSSSNNNYDNNNKQHFAFNKSDDEILSESSDDDGDNDGRIVDKDGDHDDFFLTDEPDDVNETAQEKRIRLAKSLLSKIQDEEDQGNEKDTNEAVAERLHTKALDLA